MFQRGSPSARRRPFDSTIFTAADGQRTAGGLCCRHALACNIHRRGLVVMFLPLPFWRSAEIRAAGYLRKQGYRIVASSFRVREGEIDLIAWDGDVLVFIEVKSRKNADPPESAVGLRKRSRVKK